jgi:hypothetical protein
LKLAEDLGFNSLRVYLHHALFYEDREGFFERLDLFLSQCQAHNMGVMFVLFDGCWDPEWKLGRQREPTPHVHNSGWVQSPGKDILYNYSRHEELYEYVFQTVSYFANDPRVHCWDIFNEPDNNNESSYGENQGVKYAAALELIRKAFPWARGAYPTQPITSGVWIGTFAEATLTDLDRFMLENSDVITFHSYAGFATTAACVSNLRRYNRPIMCTEYMARGVGSFFDPHLGFFQEEKVGAYNWGFVNGKSQTIYPWDSWSRNYTAPPALWFHDIFDIDGTPYNQVEVDYIRSVTQRTKLQT